MFGMGYHVVYNGYSGRTALGGYPRDSRLGAGDHLHIAPQSPDLLNYDFSVQKGV